MRFLLGDTETTGVGADDAVCEVAWAEIDEDFNILAQGASLINPGKPIHYAASAVNGITDAMVADAPTLEEYMVSVGHPLFGDDVVFIAHNCVTGDHEVRTQEGWVRLDQLSDGEQVMQWDSATSKLSFTDTQVIRKHYSGPMFEWNSTYHKGVYTPDHRMYFKGKQGRDPAWRTTTALEMSRKGPNAIVIPVSGIFDSGNKVDVSPLEARLLEMIRSDACIQRKESSYRAAVRLKFKRRDKIERCFSLLDSLNISYSVKVGSDGVTSFCLHTDAVIEKLATLLGDSKSKSYGPWVLDMSLAARLALLDEIQYWDGSVVGKARGKNKQVVLHSSKRDDVYWLVEMAIMSGLTAYGIYNTPNTRGFSRPDGVIHSAMIRPRKHVKTLYKPEQVSFDGTVYCLTVPTGAFLVRRGGVTWVTGNCAFDHRFLKNMLHDDTQLLCTLKVARRLYPDAANHKQGTLAAMLGIEVAREKAHSADGDIDVLLKLVKQMCADAGCGLIELLHIQSIPLTTAKIPFGKHKGTKLSDLPKSYVSWLLEKATNLDPDLRTALSAL